MVNGVPAPAPGFNIPPPGFNIPDNGGINPQQNEIDQILQEITEADTCQQLSAIYNAKIEIRFPGHIGLLTAFIQKQNTLARAAINETNRLKKTICSFTTVVNGVEITDVEFSNKVREQIPPNTYTQVKVTTLASYQFVSSLTRARKIELMRTEWGWINVPVLNSIEAVCSSTFKKKSKYREIISQDTLLRGLLASSMIVGDEANGIATNQAERDRFQVQMATAYWSGKKIEIIVPFDFSENGVIKITSESKVLEFSIDTGRWIRKLFTKK